MNATAKSVVKCNGLSFHKEFDEKPANGDEEKPDCETVKQPRGETKVCSDHPPAHSVC